MWCQMVKTLWQGILTANEDSSEELVDHKHNLHCDLSKTTGEFCSDGTNTHRHASEPCHHATTPTTHKVNKVLRPPHKEAAMPAIASEWMPNSPGVSVLRSFQTELLRTNTRCVHWNLVDKSCFQARERKPSMIFHDLSKNDVRAFGKHPEVHEDLVQKISEKFNVALQIWSHKIQRPHCYSTETWCQGGKFRHEKWT